MTRDHSLRIVTIGTDGLVAKCANTACPYERWLDRTPGAHPRGQPTQEPLALTLYWFRLAHRTP